LLPRIKISGEVCHRNGWWAEAYSPEVGWAIGDGREHGDGPSWDATEAESLYAVLERELIPEPYTRDEHGIPRDWVARMRESMARLTPAAGFDWEGGRWISWRFSGRNVASQVLWS
jgi:glucan phosphorylase